MTDCSFNVKKHSTHFVYKKTAGSNMPDSASFSFGVVD